MTFFHDSSRSLPIQSTFLFFFCFSNDPIQPIAQINNLAACSYGPTTSIWLGKVFLSLSTSKSTFREKRQSLCGLSSFQSTFLHQIWSNSAYFSSGTHQFNDLSLLLHAITVQFVSHISFTFSHISLPFPHISFQFSFVPPMWGQSSFWFFPPRTPSPYSPTTSLHL